MYYICNVAKGERGHNSRFLPFYYAFERIESGATTLFRRRVAEIEDALPNDSSCLFELWV